MTSGKGANPDSSEPDFDLESQLDDLLEQIEEAEPGLVSTPAPKTDQPSAKAAKPATSAAAQDDLDDIDFEADFETVQAVVDPDAESSSADVADVSDLESLDEILSQAADTDSPPAEEPKPAVQAAQKPPVDDVLAAIAELQDSDDTQAAADDQFEASFETPAQTASDATSAAEAVGEVDKADETVDEDAAMFSPDDFITSEQAVDEDIAETPEQAQAIAAEFSTESADTSNDTTDEAEADTDDADDPLGLDLASQIQQLLDDAKADDQSVSSDDVAPDEAAAQAVDDSASAINAGETDDTDDMFDNASFDTVAEVDSQAKKETAAQAAAPASKSKNAIDPPVLPENNIPDSDDLVDTLNEVAKAVAKPEPLGEAKLEDVAPEDDIINTREKATTAQEPVQTQAVSEPVQQPQQVAASDQDDATDADAMSLDDIDQMLADEADQAVAGDFETLSEVLEPSEAAAESQPQEAATADETQAQVQAQDSEEDADSADADDDEMDFAGSFETTDDIITQEPENSSEQGLSEGAQAVARELDEQPENKHRDTAGSIGPDGDSSAGSSRRSLNLAAFTRVPDVAKQVCETISRPMEAVAPQTRDMVGYIGLITLFWGTVAVMVKIIFAMNS